MILEDIYKETKEKMSKSVNSFKEELKHIRTGRAHHSMLDNILVEYHDNLIPINQLATIVIPEPRLIVLQPWDKSVITNIEKAILKSDLGITPNSDGKVIRLPLPKLTEEQRKQYVKLVHQKAEEYRVTIRNIRRDANEKIKLNEKQKNISEDDSRHGQNEIQKITDGFIKQIDDLMKEKEKEILQI